MLPVDRRKEELEKKRARIAELRKAKEERKSALLDVQKRDSIGGLVRDRKDIDDLVASLVGERPRSRTTVREGDQSPSPSPSVSLDTPKHETNAEINASPTPPVEKIQPTLTSAEFVFFDAPPKEKVMYTKEVQTEAIEDEPAVTEVEESPAPNRTVEFEERSSSPTPSIPEPEHKPPPELSSEKITSILGDDEFLKFFDQSSKLIERALNDNEYDFTIDYAAGDTVSDETSEEKGVKYLCTFADEKHTANRSVTDVSWSQKHPELALAAYGKNEFSTNDADGLVLVWNLHLLERPEFVFKSQSDVTVASFAPFHPNCIVGGTYSGQILVWDTRARSTPVLKTPLSAVGHTHPVYSLSVVGTQNAHNIVTASTDGLVCSWHMDMLAQPQEVLELLHPTHAKMDGVSITTMAFPKNETATMWIGSEDGGIYQVNRYDRAGSKAGISPNENYKGHHGLVTGMDFHPQSAIGDVSGLFLTSSIDWTVKLWRTKSKSKVPTSEPILPIYSFEEGDDYVTDVRWSPTHASLFGSVDGSGHFNLFDINQELEAPLVRTQVGKGKALNKLGWAKDGRRTIFGSSDGNVYVYDIGQVAQPRPDEWHALQRTLADVELR